MAEGFLKSLDSNIEVFSAGTEPTHEVHPLAKIVMKEAGVDLEKNYPKSVSEFLSQNFDFVITVCGGANDVCPTFIGKVKNRIHIGFEDPASAKGSAEEILNQFRTIRDEIKAGFYKFYCDNIKNK